MLGVRDCPIVYLPNLPAPIRDFWRQSLHFQIDTRYVLYRAPLDTPTSSRAIASASQEWVVTGRIGKRRAEMHIHASHSRDRAVVDTQRATRKSRVSFSIVTFLCRVRIGATRCKSQLK